MKPVARTDSQTLRQSPVTSLLLAIALLFATGCGKKSAPSNVLAQVGNVAITTEDFQAEVARRQANRQPLPDKQTLLEQLVARATLVQSALAAGLDKTPEVRRATEDLLIATFQEKELAPKIAAVKISAAEISAAYTNELARFTQPAKAQLAFIFIAADAKLGTNELASLAARAEAAAAAARALPADTKGFGKVAADFSDDQLTRYRGGDGGWFTAAAGFFDRWPKAIVDAGLALEKSGAVTAVLREAKGFYLVKKTDVRAATVAPFAQVQANIERRLRVEKVAQTEAEFQTQMQAAVKVQRDAALLANVAYPTSNLDAATSVPPSLPTNP